MSATTGDVMAALRLAADVLSDVDLDVLSERDCLDLTREAWVQHHRIAAGMSQLIAWIHQRGAAKQDGAASTQAWLRTFLRIGDPDRQVRVAMASRAVPEVGAAYARGELSYSHVAVVANVLPDLDEAVLTAGAGKVLAELAAELTPQAFARVAARMRDHFDPEAADRRTRLHTERRDLRVNKTFEGMVAIEGMLDPEGGQLLLNALAAFTPPRSPGDGRTPGQRRADALADVCRIALRGAPSAGGEKPHVSVIVDLGTLRGDAPGGWAPLEHGAALVDGAPIPPATARRLACDAGVIPAVLGGASEVLDLGRLARVVSVPLRRALILRDGGCRFPGCDRPPQWTDAHHLVPWSQGGRTDLDNLLLLCRAHHMAVHEGQWKIHYHVTSNTVTATRPNGQKFELTSKPKRQPP
jgi:hypothetical protein